MTKEEQFQGAAVILAALIGKHPTAIGEPVEDGIIEQANRMTRKLLQKVNSDGTR